MQHDAPDDQGADDSRVSPLGPAYGLTKAPANPPPAVEGEEFSKAHSSIPTWGEEAVHFSFEKEYTRVRLHIGNIKQPLSEQVVCENEAAKWSELWNEGADYSVLDTEWNDRSMAPNPREGYCPLLVHHMRAAIRTFPKGTAKAADNRAVRAFDALSDDALNGLCKIFCACELAGVWPRCLSLVLI